MAGNGLFSGRALAVFSFIFVFSFSFFV